MSEARLVIREAERDWSGKVHGGTADRIIAALSADPVTIDEFAVALERFERSPGNREFLAALSTKLCDEPLGVRLFGIGSRLAEIVVDLRAGCDREAVPPESQRQIDDLNRRFGNLREVLNSPDATLAGALFQPIIDRFTDSLASVSAERPELVERTEGLTAELRELLSPPPPEIECQPGDDGLPF